MKKFLESMVFFFCIAVFIGLLVVSCMPEPLEVKGVPAGKPEIVVASQLIPDRTIVVSLTRTIGISEVNEKSSPEEILKNIAVNDAVVIISGPAGTDTLEFIENGIYGGLLLPLAEGEVYELKVKSETLGEIYAVTKVLQGINFTSVEAGLVYNIYDDTLAQVTYSLTDPAEKNWYMINLQKVKQEGSLLQDVLNPESFTFLLDDTDFNGQTFEDQLEFYQEGMAPGDTVIVSLSNISEDYYRFMELRLDNRPGLTEFLGEPLNFPTNVKGGKGFFNLHIPDILLLPLKDEE